MNDVIKFYHNPMSRARIAHWMLEEIGAPYETILIDFQKGESRQPKFLAINPMGKLPTIEHRGVVVTEAAAICAYLADAFPKADLAPKLDDPKRGTYFRWLFFAATNIEPALMDKQFGRAMPERRGQLGYGTYDDVISTLEKAVQPGPFILGEKFSAADLYMASSLQWGMFVKGIDPKPVFTDYVARCTERAGYKRFMEKTPSFK